MSGLYADHVLLGGRVRTLDAQGTEAEAIALRGDAIAAVGTDAEVRETIGPSTQVTELRGRTVLPGLTDAHVHLASDASRAVGAVECRDFYDPAIRSVSDVLERIGNAARAGFVERRLGSLEVGKLADLIVLADDPARADPDHFAQLPVELTIVGGQSVQVLQPA